MVAHVALISLAKGISNSELSRVGAAMQKQVMRDFAPIWRIPATVDVFAKLQDVPLGYWPVVVLEDIHANALGYHQDKNGQPFSFVKHTNGWEQTVSHEVLEMLADPFGNRIVAGRSIKPGQGRVQYLVEVCDPSEDIKFGYTVNGVTVSDFYTPNFFDPVKNAAIRYSFTGAITRPRTILEGGYLSWFDPKDNHIWQQIWFGAKKEFRDLGEADPTSRESMRAWVDRRTQRPELSEGITETKEELLTAREASTSIEEASAAWAASMREQIESLNGRVAATERIER